MGTEAPHDLTAAYALDALDPAERLVFEAHLARCEHCRRELAALSETVGMLAYAVEGPAPPPQLRERILESARAERQNVVPLRPRWAIPAAATAAVAVAAAVVLAVWASSLSHRVSRLEAQSHRQERVASILSSTGAHRYAFGHGERLVVTPTGEAALVFRRLPRARPGMTYEAWVAEGGKPKPAGTFNAGTDVTSVALEQPVPRGATVMVTQERSRGTAAPTRAPIFTVNT
jgi:Anti-sigma-K factor rskA/Putative zinc-finger